MMNQTRSNNEKELFLFKMRSSIVQSFYILAWIAIAIMVLSAIEDWFSNQAQFILLYTAFL